MSIMYRTSLTLRGLHKLEPRKAETNNSTSHSLPTLAVVKTDKTKTMVPWKPVKIRQITIKKRTEEKPPASCDKLTTPRASLATVKRSKLAIR